MAALLWREDATGVEDTHAPSKRPVTIVRVEKSGYDWVVVWRPIVAVAMPNVGQFQGPAGLLDISAPEPGGAA